MIHQIYKLKNFGIFHDYKSTKELEPFSKYNLFYGWNGSGKSTLAKLFFSLSEKKMHEHFSKGEFIIKVKDKPDISDKNVASNTLNIRVFNRDFIERNVNFEESKTNTILILSEEKKDEMNQYKKSQEDYESKKNAFKLKSTVYDKSKEDLQKNLSKWASTIKKSFELIQTTNSYYLNYDRTRLSSFIRENKTKIQPDSILKSEEVLNLKSAIKPTKKIDIDLAQIKKINVSETKMLFRDIENLLSKNILSKQIERLKNNPEINTWVMTGLDIHFKHNSTECEFCKQELTQERLADLNNHFNIAYTEVLNEMQSLSNYIIDLKNNIRIKLPEQIEIYDEFQGDYQKLISSLNHQQLLFDEKLDSAEFQLSKKRTNPFDIIDFRFNDITVPLDGYNKELEAIYEILENHNLKNRQFENEIKKSQSKLELHFVSEILIAENYDDIETAIINQKEALDLLDKEVFDLEEQIRKLELVLINEAVGADAFNKSLSKFIGRKDISIEFDKLLKGYKLIRAGESNGAKNLSEGEKTAIAFVYFISKLRENGNSIENTIVVLDDPISSFDSNHLFHSYSFLKQECEQAMQLFILTHNFQYFKLVRDWLKKKNDKKKPTGVNDVITKSNFFSIDASASPNREAAINNANKTLLDFNSEYHFIFHKLISLREIKTLDIEKAFLIANLSRKLLEGFLTFKFPKGRNEFNQLLQAGCSDSETCEKVYRFIQKYSHNQQIEFLDTPIDNLLGEGDNIVDEVFNIISNLDNAHYKEMEDVCKTNP